MLGSFRKSPAQLQALDQIADWTRRRFRLAAADTVLVTELACTSPGCPPLETVVAFWPEDGQRRQFKIFKPAAEIIDDDLPYDWLFDALIAVDDYGCSCCG